MRNATVRFKHQREPQKNNFQYADGIQCMKKLFWSSSKLIQIEVHQTRQKYVDARMIRDVKRRRLAKEYAVDRLRLLSLKRNDIIPLEIREEAGAELHAFPRDSCPVRICKRCVVTSRPRGIAYRWRLSRIVFRHLADYNKLSGIQRAMW